MTRGHRKTKKSTNSQPRKLTISFNRIAIGKFRLLFLEPSFYSWKSYSFRTASAGSICEARLAGYQLAAIHSRRLPVKIMATSTGLMRIG